MEIDSISEAEWREIRAIARELFLDDAYGKDQFKIAIQAFHEWITTEEPPERDELLTHNTRSHLH